MLNEKQATVPLLSMSDTSFKKSVLRLIERKGTLMDVAKQNKPLAKRIARRVVRIFGMSFCQLIKERKGLPLTDLFEEDCPKFNDPYSDSYVELIEQTKITDPEQAAWMANVAQQLREKQKIRERVVELV